MPSWRRTRSRAARPPTREGGGRHEYGNPHRTQNINNAKTEAQTITNTFAIELVTPKKYKNRAFGHLPIYLLWKLCFQLKRILSPWLHIVWHIIEINKSVSKNCGHCVPFAEVICSRTVMFCWVCLLFCIPCNCLLSELARKGEAILVGNRVLCYINAMFCSGAC